jgi:hypothetical protein
MRKSLFLCMMLIAGSVSFVPPASGQVPDRPKVSPQQMQEKCQEMMARHQEMQQEMAAMDARLEQLVQQMNAATGEARIDAMAAVINELFEQRQMMHEMMMEMGPGMMGQMMMHMDPEMMEMCPMMQNRHPHGVPPGQLRQGRP